MSASRLAANLEAVRGRIAAAAERSGRAAEDVRLVAVTKAVGIDEVRALYELGVRDFGENRIADGLEKVEALGAPEARWHLIGHLQRNKAGKALRGFRRIHSLASTALADGLQKEAQKSDATLEVLLEVNVSGEESKYGVAVAEAGALLRHASQQSRLAVRGLMTMAPWVEPEATRPVFRSLRELRERLRQETGEALPELSMGMSNDYEIAVEEGATMVRVGSALFA